jgi:hypothetical protein
MGDLSFMKGLKKSLAAAILVGFGFGSVPAHSAVLTNLNDSVSGSASSATPYGVTLITETIWKLTSKVIGATTTAWGIELSVKNATNDPAGNSRMTAIAFDTSPNATVSNFVANPASSWDVQAPGSLPNGLGQFEICFNDGPNNQCQGGGGGGITKGNTTVFTFVLSALNSESLTIAPVAFRYQSIGAAGGSWAYIPLPAPVLLLLGGLGGLGLMSRRKAKAA